MIRTVRVGLDEYEAALTAEYARQAQKWAHLDLVEEQLKRTVAVERLKCSEMRKAAEKTHDDALCEAKRAREEAAKSMEELAQLTRTRYLKF